MSLLLSLHIINTLTNANKLYPTCSLRKRLLLSSNSCNFEIKPNIVTKFATYVVWIFLCKNYKFNLKICHNCEDWEFFPKGLFFIGAPCRRSKHSQGSEDPRRHFFVIRDLDLWPVDFKISGFRWLILKHFFVKFGHPSCIGFWDIVRINRQTHAGKT